MIQLAKEAQIKTKGKKKKKKFTETDQQNLLTSQSPELFLC